jgi:hypothetical protein
VCLTPDWVGVIRATSTESLRFHPLDTTSELARLAAQAATERETLVGLGWGPGVSDGGYAKYLPVIEEAMVKGKWLVFHVRAIIGVMGGGSSGLICACLQECNLIHPATARLICMINQRITQPSQSSARTEDFGPLGRLLSVDRYACPKPLVMVA